MAPRNDCHLPAGREDAILNYLPVIPRPIWDRYVATGRFPGGMQTTLEETANCPYVDLMAQVRLAAVVVDDRIVQLAAPIRGLFPPGWYRYLVAATPPPPAAPARELERYRAPMAARRVSAPVLTPRIPIVTPDPPTVIVTDPGPPEPPVTPGCVAVPTIDVAIPMPTTDGFALFPDFATRTTKAVALRPGELGNSILRIPGSDHPLFGTGFGLRFTAREFMSAAGLRWIAHWTMARAQGLVPETDFRWSMGMEMLRLYPLFPGPSTSPGAPGGQVDPSWWTRDFAASHVQFDCAPIYFGRGGVYAEAGVEGLPMRRRWRKGGAVPAPYVGTDSDALEHETTLSADFYSGKRSLTRGIWTPNATPLFDAQGRRRELQTPEMANLSTAGIPDHFTPRLTREAWVGRDVVVANTWAGPPPGAFLVG